MAKLTKRKQAKSNKQVQENVKKASNITNRKKRKVRPQKRFLYSQEALEQAIALVKNKTCSLNKAAKQYGIPVGTLFNKVNGISPLKRRMGPNTVLTEPEEKRIKQWILDKAEIGYPMHHMIVREAVKKVLDNIDRPNPFKTNMPGLKWLKLFLNRHPEIKNKRTEMLSRVRAAVTEPRIRAWFKDVNQYLSNADALDVLSDPSRIYNLDETGVCLCPKTGKLLAPVKQKNVYSISPGQERQQITVLCCFSASGVSVRPMIMYAYKRSIPHEIINSVPDGYSIGHSETGWMTTATFYEYMINCFYPQLLANGVTFPVILFFDGHSSHISIELHDFCAEKQILLYCFIPHASHIMQPLDVGVFRPLKLCWRKAVAEHAQKSNKVITKVNFAPIFHNAYTELLKKPEIIEKSFERSGIYPFNADKVDYSKCITYRRENIKKSLLHESNTDPVVCASPSADIECQIPKEILKEFEEHLFFGTEPAQEKILFSIWRKTKQPCEKQNDLNDFREDLNCDVIESIETAVISHESVLNLKDQNIQYFDHSSIANNVSIEFIDCEYVSNSYSSATDIGHTITKENNVNVQNLKENIDQNMQVNLEKMTNVNKHTKELVLHEEHVQKEIQVIVQIAGNDSVPVETESPLDFSKAKVTSEASTCFSQNEDGNSNDSGVYIDTFNSFQTKTMTEQDDGVLDLCINSKVKNNTNKNTLSTAPTVLNDNVLLNPFSSSIKPLPFGGISAVVSKDFSKIVGNDINIKKEILHSNLTTSHSNVDQVWKEHLHFPRIETSKVKKSKIIQAPIYALTSEQWKLEYLKKKEDEEKLKQEKEAKKKIKEEEKLFKQKIKVEEIENKKKSREEAKIRQQKIKQEQAESRKKLKVQEKLKKIEEKNKLKELRQNKIKEKAQQKIEEKVFTNKKCTKQKSVVVKKRKIRQTESSTALEGTDLALMEKENSTIVQKNAERWEDSYSPSKKKKNERILQKKEFINNINSSHT